MNSNDKQKNGEKTFCFRSKYLFREIYIGSQN